MNISNSSLRLLPVCFTLLLCSCASQNYTYQKDEIIVLRPYGSYIIRGNLGLVSKEDVEHIKQALINGLPYKYHKVRLVNIITKDMIEVIADDDQDQAVDMCFYRKSARPDRWRLDYDAILYIQ